jgi:hypothetical protein
MTRAIRNFQTYRCWPQTESLVIDFVQEARAVEGGDIGSDGHGRTSRQRVVPGRDKLCAQGQRQADT